MRTLLLLIQQECDVNIPSNNGSTPLHKIAQWGTAEMMNTIIKKGARVQINSSNQTPLHQVCYNFGKKDVNKKVELLLKIMTPEEVDLQDENGYTALHFALFTASPATALLLKRGTHLFKKDKSGHTPLLCPKLTFAPFPNQFLKMIEEDCLAPEKFGFTSLEEMVQLLSAKDKKDDTQFHTYAPTQYSEKILESLAKSGLPIRIHGKTLVDAAWSEYHKLYKEYKLAKEMRPFVITQEKHVHNLLRITAIQVSCAIVKEIFSLFDILPELQQHIMRRYYDLNIETIIALKYKNDEDYYQKRSKSKNEIKQNLITDREALRLLWRD